ncbi:hypothetical protein ACFOKF_18890 [Sphingobium rhizovicinum]|uniref:Uncharacterized protein n=1 Tax=Sphingobium rhizovicinum TaxID=432308 RepID=A0ABV7NLD0_9SPHN
MSIRIIPRMMDGHFSACDRPIRQRLPPSTRPQILALLVKARRAIGQDRRRRSLSGSRLHVVARWKAGAAPAAPLVSRSLMRISRRRLAGWRDGKCGK